LVPGLALSCDHIEQRARRVHRPAAATGNYYVAAVRRVPTAGNGAWQDPQFLDSLAPGAVAVTLGDGGTQVIRLPVD